MAQTLANHHTVTVASRTLTFKAPEHHKHSTLIQVRSAPRMRETRNGARG